VNIHVLTATGERKGEIALDDGIFGARVNVPLMHQVVVAQLAAARAGTHSSKTRGEVRGGGAKPWRQKGTGRARHGSIREPQWKGGGAAFGPKPRDHSFSVPKKMKASALRSALSVRAGEERIVVFDGLELAKPKTKEAIAALKAWNVEGKSLLVLVQGEENLAYSFRNLPDVHVLAEDQLNVYDIMNADNLIFSKGAIEAFQARLSGSVGKTSESGGVRGVAAPRAAAGSPSEALPGNEREARETPRSTGKEAT
jgi:large subunit ribosomal protein L4